VNAWWRWGRLATGLTLVVVLYFAVPVDAGTAQRTVVRILISVLVLGALAYTVAVLIRLEFSADDRRIDGLVLAMAAGVLVFALGFYSIEMHDPGQIYGLHTKVDALYFAMTTALTVGYGDVHAHGQLARGVVLVQMVFDVVVLAAAATTLTSRLKRTAASRAADRRERR
jgi:voltage-gated potassium channel